MISANQVLADLFCEHPEEFVIHYYTAHEVLSSTGAEITINSLIEEMVDGIHTGETLEAN